MEDTKDMDDELQGMRKRLETYIDTCER